MPRLHWPRRSHYRGDAVDVVGPATVEVPDDAVEHLRSRGWVDPPGDDATDDGDDEAADADASDDNDGDEFDAGAFVDRTPMSEVVSDIESGDYDDRLDAIEAAEADGRDREGVADAIEARREG